MLTKYGYSTIGAVAIIVFIFIAIALLANSLPLRLIFSALAVALTIFTLNFFRDPERNTPPGDDFIVSPADGKVLLIKEVQENSFINGKGTQISVFMSPLNVHVNRIPIDGKVGLLRYVKGKYLVAFDDKASTENERSEIGIISKFGPVFFTQVAGYVARRIVYDLKEGDSVKIGTRFGMIKFGSRVDVIAPPAFEPVVKNGQITKAGETILFRLKRN